MKKSVKISKGYRLRPVTHSKIRELQKKLRGTMDEVIYMACKKLLEENKKNLIK